MSTTPPQLPRLVREYIAAEKESTRVWLRAEMDRLVGPLVDSVFDRLTNKLMVKMDLQRILPGDGRDGERVDQVKQEIEEDTDEMPLQNVMDNAPEANEQIGECVKREIKEEEEDGDSETQINVIEGLAEDNQVGDNDGSRSMENAAMDCVKQEIKEEFVDGQMLDIKEEEEEGEANEVIANEGDEADEVNRMSMNNTNMNKSARHDKRKLQVPQTRNEPTDRDNQQEDEDDAGEGTSVAVKRHRQSRPTTSSTEQKQIIRGESNANEPTTNPTQPNLVQPNRHLQCSHCLKSFDRNSNLQAHLRVHTGERPFQCGLCNKRFTQKVILENHQRTHSGERPFVCRHCAQSFTTSNIRNTHERAIHLHVKPYRCKQCGQTATARSNLITHIRVVHFGLPHTIKEQQALNIIDERDPRELIEKV